MLSNLRQISNLVRMLGHDIAGPVTVITNYSDMMTEGEVSSAQIEKASKVIKRNSEAIQTLVSKVRELNALETGKKELHLINCDLSVCVENAVVLMKERFEQKKVNLVMEKTGSKFLATAEPDILGLQVIPNLLSNALKFSTPDSTVKVELSAEDKIIEVKICDQGVGIPQNILSNLFSYSKKTTRVGTGGEKGTGFGMPLVKSFVEKMHGEIDVISKSIEDDKDGHGTTMILRFSAT